MIGQEQKAKAKTAVNYLKNKPLKEIAWLVITLVVLMALPFLVMVRTAVFLHVQYACHAWICLLGGVLASAGLLFLYISYGRVFLGTNTRDLTKNASRYYTLAFLVALLYCGQTVLFFSAANTKGEAVRSEFTSLHPVLRLAVSTLVFIDRDLLITDAKRFPEDYHEMGLPSKRHSLHYRQSDGYVHAFDVRTQGRSFISNALAVVYFRTMGFRTLRHRGTADHLHVSLKSHDAPGGI